MKVLKEIILHIGLHKTATTSIQYALANNDSVLKHSGFLYPIFNNGYKDLDNHSIPLLSMFLESPEKYHMNIKFGFSDSLSCEELNKKYYDQLFSSINNGCCDKLILSAEGLTKLNEEELRRFKRFLDELSDNIKIIACVRNPVDYARSVIQELVKGGAKLEDAEKLAVKSSSYIFKNSLNKFISVFSGSKLDVYQFEESISCVHRSPEKFFFERVGFSKVDIENIQLCSKNESLSYESILLISFLNERYPLIINGKKNKQHIARFFSNIYKVKGSAYKLTGVMLDNILKNSLSDVTWLESNFEIDTGYLSYKETVKDSRSVWSEEVLDQFKIVALGLNDEYRNSLSDFLNSILLFDTDLPDKNKLKIRSTSFFVSSLNINVFDVFYLLFINIKSKLKV